MTDQDAEKIAALVAKKLQGGKNCPLGVTQEQANAAKELAEACILGKKTAIKVFVTTIIGLIVGLLGANAIIKIIDYLK